MIKRIAVQFFGHTRTFEHTFESFKRNIIDANQNYVIDIYIHTWDKIDHATINYRMSNPSEAIMLSKENITKLNDLYKPKNILIEAQREYKDIIMTEIIESGKRSSKGCYNNAYTIFKVNNLRNKYEKENQIKYSWVIMTRLDILFYSKFSIDDILSYYDRYKFQLNPNAIYHACNPWYRGKVMETRFMTGTDLLYFSSPDAMDKATSLFNDFENNIDINNFYSMEIWWGIYWEKQGLIPMPLNYRHADPDPDLTVLGFDAVKIHRKQKNNHTIDNVNNVIIEKNIIKLFNILPIATIIKIDNNTYLKLFDFIPVLRRERINNYKSIYYLFNLINIHRI
jgi:hypothetical protein